MGVPLARLFLTSLKPVITILGLCSVGVIMARKGVLADEKRKALNQLVFMVFVPSLICDRLASSLSVQGLLHLWPIVVNVLVSCANGALLGCLQVLLVRPPRFFVRHIIAMTALGNLGNLPLVIVPVVAQSEDLFKMDSEEGARLGQTYVVMGMLMAIVMQWTVAYNLLKKPADLDDQAASPALPVTAESPTSSSSEPKLEASFVEMVRDSLDFRRSVAGAASSPLPWRRAEECEATSPAGDDSPGELSLPTLPRNATTARPWGSEDSDSGASTSRSSDAEGLRHGLADDGKLFGADDATQPLLVGPHQPADRSGAGSSWRLTIRRVDPPDRVECSVRRVVGAVRRAINPPLAACMMGAVIGMVPDLKHLFYAGSDGAAPPLGLITDLVKRLAGAMIPCIMLVLGASLHRGPGPAMRNIPVRIAVSVVICRLVLVPLLGTALILSLVRCGLLPIPNRMFLFVLLVQHATPPALNLNTVATLNGNADQELSAVLFWCYIACSCILPLIMTLQLLVVQHVA